MRKTFVLIQFLHLRRPDHDSCTARIAWNTFYFSPLHGPALAVKDLCEPSPPRRGPTKSEPAHSSRRCARPFPLLLCCCGGNQEGQLDPSWRPNRRGIAHSVRVIRWERILSYPWCLHQTPSSIESEGSLHLVSPHRIPRQRSTHECQPLANSMAPQVEHPYTSVARMLTADLSTEKRDCSSVSLQPIGRGSTDKW